MITENIAVAAKNRHTIMLIATEKDGSIETREAEPYSYRIEKGQKYFYCYDVRKRGIRKFLVSNIISVSETLNPFIPKWPIEV